MEASGFKSLDTSVRITQRSEFCSNRSKLPTKQSWTLKVTRLTQFIFQVDLYSRLKCGTPHFVKWGTRTPKKYIKMFQSYRMKFPRKSILFKEWGKRGRHDFCMIANMELPGKGMQNLH